jgi:dolichol-phosphate mannosyltransferase
MKTLIIVPTYNEAENLPRLVEAFFRLPIAMDLLIVDDGSPDGTGDLADKLAGEQAGHMHVLHRTGKLGLGTAYLQGFDWGLTHGYDALGQMDADFSHPLDKLVELHTALADCDVAIGSRYIQGGSLDICWPWWRKTLSGFGNLYARTILGLPIKDTTGGFRLWKAATLRGMPLERVKSNGYVFQVEMAYLAHKCGFTFKEVPIYFADRRWGTSKMNFHIQAEAALRVWQVLFAYRDLK